MKLNKVLSLALATGLITTSLGATITNAERKATVPNQKNTKNVVVKKKNTVKSNKKKAEKADKNSLMSYEGAWNNLSQKFMGDPAIVKPAFMVAIRGAAVPGKESYAKKEEFYQTFFNSDYSSIVIKGNKIYYYDAAQASENKRAGKLIGTDVVKKIGKSPKDGRFTVYMSTNKKPQNKYFYITKLNPEESLKHFHILMGKSAKELDKKLAKLADMKLTNFPTFMAHNSTDEQIRLEICTPKISDYAGTWNTIGDMYNDPANAEKVQAAVKKRNPNVSDDELKSVVEKTKKSFALDFKSVVMTGDKVTFYEGMDGSGKVVASGEYTFVGYDTTSDKPDARYIPKFEGKEGSTYKYMYFAPPHGYGEGHAVTFHVWYGNTKDEVAAMKTKPTFYDTTATAEEVKNIIE